RGRQHSTLGSTVRRRLGTRLRDELDIVRQLSLQKRSSVLAGSLDDPVRQQRRERGLARARRLPRIEAGRQAVLHVCPALDQRLAPTFIHTEPAPITMPIIGRGMLVAPGRLRLGAWLSFFVSV